MSSPGVKPLSSLPGWGGKPTPPPEPAPPERPPKRVHARTFWALVVAIFMQNPGWFLSFGFHAVLLGCLSVPLIREFHARTPLGIEASLADVEGGGGGGFENLIQTPLFESSGSAPAMSDSAVQLREEASEAARRTLGDLNSLGIGTGSSGSGDGGEGSGGEGSGSGRGPGLGAGFFGAKGAGKTFVYVVDMSGSMEGERFRRAVAELIRSINKLSAEQSFYVIFFNDKMFPMFDPQPARGLIPANTSNKSRATRWIRGRKPSSTTDPKAALEKALGMKPQVIFLLTDGELDDPAEVRHMIRRENKTNVVIHTIAFENEDGATTLETIAAENNGEFRFVR